MDASQRPMPGRASHSGDIERKARAILEAHSHFIGRARLFEFDCDENVLVVRGCVPTYYLKQILQTALKGLEGVRRIDNQVWVDASEGFHSSRTARRLVA